MIRGRKFQWKVWPLPIWEIWRFHRPQSQLNDWREFHRIPTHFTKIGKIVQQVSSSWKCLVHNCKPMTLNYHVAGVYQIRHLFIKSTTMRKSQWHGAWRPPSQCSTAAHTPSLRCEWTVANPCSRPRVSYSCREKLTGRTKVPRHHAPQQPTFCIHLLLKRHCSSCRKRWTDVSTSVYTYLSWYCLSLAWHRPWKEMSTVNSSPSRYILVDFYFVILLLNSP